MSTIERCRPLRVAVLPLAVITGSLPVRGEEAESKAILPETLTFSASPTGVVVAPIIGTAAAPNALYALYARYDAGVKSYPHTHPDQRVMTVLSGTFYAGTGQHFDETTLKPLGPGAVLVIPANTSHYGWAKDGAVLVQEVGMGPSGTKVWPRTEPR